LKFVTYQTTPPASQPAPIVDITSPVHIDAEQ
jgi:hypothetical protein